MSEDVRVTYQELAQARGITPAAARRLTLRHRWPKQVGNDGLSRVVVPSSELSPHAPFVMKLAARDASVDAPVGAAVVVASNPSPPIDIEATGRAVARFVVEGMQDTTRTLEHAVRALDADCAVLREQLSREVERADRAEAWVGELQRRLQQERAERPAVRRSWWRWWP